MQHSVASGAGVRTGHRLSCVCSALLQVNCSIGESLANSFGALDEALENAGVLSKLEPPPPMSEATKAEFDEVRAEAAAGCGL